MSVVDTRGQGEPEHWQSAGCWPLESAVQRNLTREYCMPVQYPRPRNRPMPSALPPALLPVPLLDHLRERLRYRLRSGESYARADTMMIYAHVRIPAVGGVPPLGFKQRAKSARASLH
jgi:hypothetical protein